MNPHPAKRIRVSEGATGILTLRQNGRCETYLPDCDMDAARELLLEFQELKDSEGKPLKCNYVEAGHNWYPAMVSHLFWYLFIPWVKFRPLALKHLEGACQFEFDGPGQFSGLLGLLNRRGARPSGPSWKVAVHDFLWRLHNRLAARRGSWDLVFFRFAFDDFRSRDILTELRKLGLRFLEAVPAPGSRGILRSTARRTNHYFYAQPPREGAVNAFKRVYRLDDLPCEKAALFQAGIRLVEFTLTSCLRDTKAHRANFQRAGIRLFYGFDDANSYFFPLLYAARELGLPTIGHQHGAYVKRHAGYIMEGISREKYEWYDRVLVWGEYWRRKMIKDAPVHPPERWVVGTNKLANSISKIPSLPKRNTPRSILIPYEFLADTAAVGRYIKKFVEFGYEVWFRPRSDEPLERQLESYQLDPATRAEVKIWDGPLTPEFLSNVDIVAGTMTTLVYELLPARKIVWYLSTPYRHLHDLVEEGLAHKISLEDIHPPGKMPPRFLVPTECDAEFLFSTQPLSEVLHREILCHFRESKQTATSCTTS